MPEITQEEFEQFESYRGFGTVEEVESVMGEIQNSRLDMIASKSGYKRSVLEKLLNDLPEGHTLGFTDDGDAVIQTATGDTPLKEFAEKEWSDFLPSLKVSTSEKKSTAAYVPQTGKQRIAGKKKTASAADSYMKAKYGWAVESNK